MNSLALLSVLLVQASTAPVTGVVLDGWSNQPLAGTQLKDTRGQLLAVSDGAGRFQFQVRHGTQEIVAQPIGSDFPITKVHLPRNSNGQLLAMPLLIHLLPLSPAGEPADNATGLPPERQNNAASPADPQRPAQVWSYSLPSTMPENIKVLRCPGTTCCSAPGDGVEELPFEEYVKGVVYGEVGVFRSMTTIDGRTLSTAEKQTGSVEVFKTLAVSSRSYALYWYLRRQQNNPGYDIRDGTCEQVYDDARDNWVNSAVDATAGQVMALADGGGIDKFEYASSCRRLGSLPYGISADNPHCNKTLHDHTGLVGCVNTWCGHDTSDMGHQRHPCDLYNCRCLVRGICQWGAAERSFAGQRYTQILGHYQPQLTLLALGSVPLEEGMQYEQGDLVGYVRKNSVDDEDAGLAGVRVELSGDDITATAETDAQGYYAFAGLASGQNVTVTATLKGYTKKSQGLFLDPATTMWWGSLALRSPKDDEDKGGCGCSAQNRAGEGLAAWFFACFMLGFWRRQLRSAKIS